MRLVFPFTAATPTAVFRRFDTLWLVFDTDAPIDVSRLLGDTGRLIRNAEVTRSGLGQVVRLKLARPRLSSASTNGLAWTIALGDIALDRTAPLTIARASIGAERAAGVVPFDAPHAVHRLADPDVGDTLLVVTALAPARGVLRTQDFVEFRALASTHGLVVQPLADDVAAELHRDKVLITRPNGLTLSAVSYQLADDVAESGNGSLFDSNRWGADRRAKFIERQKQLVQAAAGAPEGKRAAARLDLARFYLGRELFPEAKAVLDVSTSDDRPTAEQPSGLMLRAVAKIMMDRSTEALKDLANPIISNLKDATLWRAFAHARQGKWNEAREGFKSSSDDHDAADRIAARGPEGAIARRNRGARLRRRRAGAQRAGDAWRAARDAGGGRGPVGPSGGKSRSHQRCARRLSHGAESPDLPSPRRAGCATSCCAIR